jgi:hypothetical protein
MPAGTVGALRNRAVQMARGSVLAFIDADCVADPHWLAGGLAALADGGVAVGNVYDLPTGSSWIEQLWFGTVAPTRWQTQELWSGNMVVSRQAFDRAGGFDESLVSSEDVVLAHALCRQGQLFCDPRVRVTHIGGPTNLRAFARQQIWHGFEAWTLFRRGIPRGTFLPSVVTALAYGIMFGGAVLPWPNRLSVVFGGLVLLCAASLWHSAMQYSSARGRSVLTLLRLAVLNMIALTAYAVAMILRALGIRWSGRRKTAEARGGTSRVP